jgi:hypothetical protein
MPLYFGTLAENIPKEILDSIDRILHSVFTVRSQNICQKKKKIKTQRGKATPSKEKPSNPPDEAVITDDFAHTDNSGIPDQFNSSFPIVGIGASASRLRHLRLSFPAYLPTLIRAWSLCMVQNDSRRRRLLKPCGRLLARPHHRRVHPRFLPGVQ